MKSVNQESNIIIIAKKTGQLLKQKKLKLVTAESCTGGGIAYSLTAITGAAKWFEQGFVTYSNLSKQCLLNVSPETLHRHGAVSKETVIQMAQGALHNAAADISIAVTGIAGPGGGSSIKPVGTVWFGFGFKKNHAVKTYHQIFSGNRHEVRDKTILFALEKLFKLIN